MFTVTSIFITKIVTFIVYIMSFVDMISTHANSFF